jgi:hypothetical protein
MKHTIEGLAQRQRELLEELAAVRQEIAARHGEEHDGVGVEAISQEPMVDTQPVKRSPGRPKKARG